MINKGSITYLMAMMTALVVVTSPSRLAFADDFDLLSIGVRAVVGEKRTLGKVAPESFHEYDLMATLQLPLEEFIPPNLGLEMRLLVSVGAIQGAGKTAGVVSVIPVLAIATQDGRFVVDAGLGAGLITERYFGRQDFGGLLQFALTAGCSAPLYGSFAAGYRFLHYSDAGLHGPDTVGTDFHTVELIYRF